MKKRLDYIDILRVLACFLVILTHSAMPAVNSTDGIWCFSYSLVSSPSSELFLALSGAVLLPVKVSMKEFYKRRFLKLLPPVLIWSVLIIFIYILLDKTSIENGIITLSQIFIKPVIGVYWFIYIIIGLYLLAPIISKWLIDASRRQVEFFLLLWSFNLIMPYLNLFIPDIFQQTGSHYWMLNYFGGFLGYWMLGYYLRWFPISIGLNKRFITIFILFFCYCLFIGYMKITNQNVEEYTDNLQIGSALGVILLFTMIQHLTHIPKKLKSLIAQISKYSFGIYLVHIIIVRELVWRFFEHIRFTPLLETPTIALISLSLSFLILYFLSKLPYGKYITGVG